MRKYRLKIKHLNNDQIQYSPQVGVPVWFGLYISWVNILTYKNTFSPETSENIAHWFDTEEEALDSIEKYKVYINEIDGKEAKTINYKNL